MTFVTTTTGSFIEGSPLLTKQVSEVVSKLVEKFQSPREVLLDVAASMRADFKLGLASDYSLPDVAATVEKDEMPLLMLPSHVNRMPTGEETGTFLAIDLGGTNLRVCAFTLIEGGNPNPITTDQEIAAAEVAAAENQSGHHVSTIDCPKHRCIQAHYRIPDHVKTGSLKQLAYFISEMICSFLRDHNKEASECIKIDSNIKPYIAADDDDEFKIAPAPQSLGFTFSFPVRQLSLKVSTLLHWTKGFQIPDAVGKDIAAAVQEELCNLGLPITINALINDTVGTLLASGYDNPSSVIGVILGTGTNAAYLESRGNITKLPLAFSECAKDQMIINTEWGAFNKMFKHMPRTFADEFVDNQSLNSGHHWFEKMISGMYLGEITAKSILELMKDPVVKLLDGNPELMQRFSARSSLPTKFMQWVEEKEEKLRPAEVVSRVKKLFSFDVSERDSLIICELITEIRRRAARLSAMAIYALLTQMDLPKTKPVAVAIDGTLWLKYPNFKNTVILTLEELIGSEKMKLITLESARDGSGMGAAVVASLYA